MERTSEIGPSILVRGEVHSQEDLIVSGRIEGTVEMNAHRLTVAKDAELKASIHAREIVVSGAVVGTVQAVERVILQQTADVEGDVTTPALKMDDGAVLKGQVEMDKAVWSSKVAGKHLQLAS
jgi:cytoskeletal protein CcmA (bactofilin family)